MLIRRGTCDDQAKLCALLELFEMGAAELSPEDFLIAEEAEDLAGAVLLQRVGEDTYLRAMAVHPTWQGHGFGSRLVKSLVAGLDQVKLVARGPVVSFYRKLGFHPAPWEAIDSQMRAECDDCPVVKVCQPVPMIFENSRYWTEHSRPSDN